MFCHCSPYLINFVFSIITHVCTAIYDVKVRKNGIPGSTDQFFTGHPLDEDVISMMIDMGFPGSSAKESLKCVETNNIVLGMDLFFSHLEEPMQEYDEIS